MFSARLLGRDIAGYLYRAYRRDLSGAGPDSPVSVAGLSDALAWASTASGADRPRLIDLQQVPGGDMYAPHPLLAVLADDPGEDVSWPVPGVLWDYCDRYFDGDQRRDIGYTALERGTQVPGRKFVFTASPVQPRQVCQGVCFSGPVA